MAIHIIGGANEKAAVAMLRGTRWWAERGFVHCEHPTEGHHQYRVREILMRANALSEMLGKSTEKDLIRYSDLRKEIQDFLDDIVEVCRIAREQGDPEDPDAIKDRARRRPQSITVPRNFQLDM